MNDPVLHLNRNERELIRAYCYKAGVVYYDVAIGLADQISDWIEADMKHCNCSFRQSFEKMQESFTKEACLSFLSAEAATLRIRLRREWVIDFLGCFTWPRMGVSFLLLALVWVLGQYLVLDRFAIVAINGLNILNFVILSGGGEIVYSNRSTSIEKLIGADYLQQIERRFLVLPLVYGSVSIINGFGWLLPPTANEIMFYIFPFVLLVSLAFRNTSIIAHEKIRRAYPAAFDDRGNGQW